MTQRIHRSHFQRLAAPLLPQFDFQLWPPSSLLRREATLPFGHRFSQRNHLTSSATSIYTGSLCINTSLPTKPSPKHHCSTNPFSKLYHRHFKGISTTTTPTSTWPTFTFEGPSTPLTIWDATRPASISATRTWKLTTIHSQPPLRHHSQPLVGTCSPPTIRHYLPTLSTRTLVLQHHSTQTTPTHFTTHPTNRLYDHPSHIS